ncbi:MAG: hypothetical protein JJU27_06620 [Gammaproteobacteria bacterium]|nr:hypothetical protein [Gammaproteobacteria bacterium]
MTDTLIVADTRRAPPLWSVLLLVAGAVVLCLALAQRAQWQSGGAPADDVVVQVADQHYQVTAARADTLALLSALRFSEGEVEARRLVDAHLEHGLDRLFAELAAQLPVFADWYYSLGGEYTRLSMLALEKSGVVAEGYVARRAEALIFESTNFAEGLDMLRMHTDTTVLQQANQTRESWLLEMLALLDDHRMPVAPLPQTQQISLDALQQQLAGYGRTEFMARFSLSSAAAAGAAAGPVIWRAASRRAATTSGRAMAARGAGRGAARVGSAAAGGAAVCAPSGPGALACALVAGAASWLAVDWALLRWDEARNRDELIAALQVSLDELQAEMMLSLTQAYDQLLAEQYDGMRSDIQRTFRPR